MTTDDRPPVWQLVPLDLPKLRPVYALGVDALTLGRDPACNISFDDGVHPHVSATHSRIQIRGERPEVEDLQSKNGTFVNGRRVERATLANGDVVQLGSRGPMFRVLDASQLKSTVAMPPVSALDRTPARPGREEFGKTTIMNLKNVLGIPVEGAGVGELVERGHRRQTWRVAIVAGVLGVLVMIGFYVMGKLGEENTKFREANEQLNREISSLIKEADAKEAAAERRSKELRAEMVAERERLLAKLSELEQGRASADEVDILRRQLTVTEDRLSRMDPIELEKARLVHVKRTVESVALIEVEWQWREKKTGILLHVLDDESTGERSLSFTDKKGEPFTGIGTGSGFCVSSEGWVITNAHVVRPEEPDLSSYDAEIKVQRLDVVFSGTSRRIPATVVKVAEATNEETVDLALLKIEPFEGMPHISDFSTSTPPPSVGSQVYLLGFPLGKHALQEGERVIASTFRGILSREVAPFFQVDAPVHQGNSGGPVVDESGRVLGVVVGVQTMPRGGVATEIGYVIPIGRAARIWPPSAGEANASPDSGASVAPRNMDGSPPVKERR